MAQIPWGSPFRIMLVAASARIRAADAAWIKIVGTWTYIGELRLTRDHCTVISGDQTFTLYWRDDDGCEPEVSIRHSYADRTADASPA